MTNNKKNQVHTTTNLKTCATIVASRIRHNDRVSIDFVLNNGKMISYLFLPEARDDYEQKTISSLANHFEKIWRAKIRKSESTLKRVYLNE